jgi:hypothetical protein
VMIILREPAQVRGLVLLAKKREILLCWLLRLLSFF